MRWRRSEPGTLFPGDIFEKYTVEKLLGKGGMGAVYLVRHNVLDSLFALKVLFPDIAKKNKQFVDRFIREAKLACKIKHPNLIAVHDAGQNKSNGMYYLVMDYVSGGSVRELLRSGGSLPPEQALAVTGQVASALNEAYRHNMVHRDIKPDNIMFTADHVAKLADLGIAKSTSDQDTMLTMEASVFGTPAYMSPEQAMDSSKVDCRADIYSLGIVLFEMLSGQRPYRGSGTMEILSQVVKEDDIPDIREYCPQLSSGIAELIRDMTAKQLEKRIATPAELLKRIHAISTGNAGASAVAAADAVQPVSGLEATMPTMVKTASAEPLDATLQTAAVSKTIPISEPTMPTMVQEASVQKTAVGQESHAEGKHVQSEITVTRRMAETQSPGLTQKNEKCFELFADKKKIAMAVIALLICFICAGLLFMLFAGRPKAPRAEVAERSGLSIPQKTLPEQNADRSLPTGALKQEGSLQTVVTERKSEPENLPEDELVSNAIVILGSSGEEVQKLKASIAVSGKFPVVFRMAEIFARYRRQLTEIIKSKPKYVVLIPSARYAELDMSRTNFETMVRSEAEMLRDNLIPFVFILSPESPESPKITQFNAVITELCSLRSYPVVPANKTVGLWEEFNRFL